jgi:hypothetical protein
MSGVIYYDPYPEATFDMRTRMAIFDTERKWINDGKMLPGAVDYVTHAAAFPKVHTVSKKHEGFPDYLDADDLLKVPDYVPHPFRLFIAAEISREIAGLNHLDVRTRDK